MPKGRHYEQGVKLMVLRDYLCCFSSPKHNVISCFLFLINVLVGAFLEMGNNPMVGATVAVSVAVYEACK